MEIAQLCLISIELSREQAAIKKGTTESAPILDSVRKIPDYWIKVPGRCLGSSYPRFLP